jgi:hypothetical protein
VSAPPLEAAPPEAIEPGGQPKLGVFRGTLGAIGLERWATAFQRRWRRKHWQYVAVVSEEIVAAAAIADLGYVGMAFALAWDRRNKRWYETQSLAPLAMGIMSQGGPAQGVLRWSDSSGAIVMERGPDGRSVVANVDTPAGDLMLDFKLPAAGKGPEPLSVVSRLFPHGLNVTHKEAGVDVRATVSLSRKNVALDPERTLALFDWSEGVPPYRIAWKWAMGAGRAVNGARIAFNFCVGYNDRDETENAVWIDGKVHRVGRVKFTVPEKEGVWRVYSADGTLDLSFEPEAERSAADNFIVVVSKYRQPVGKYRGRLPAADGNPLEIEEASGVAEDHVARW